VAIESPTFYGCLQAVQRLGLNAVEIPTDPVQGLDIEALKRVLDARPVQACWFMTTLHHPTGAIVPEARKRELVRLLAARNIPLIEDDAYAELQFADPPAPPAKAFDRQGLVLHCGSFAKCLAPGYRVGWIAAGQFAERVARAKMESSIATSLPVQQGLARMLREGGYDAHLAALRRALSTQQAALLGALERHFPQGYRVSRPQGGYFLWVECARAVNALEVHRAALESGITLAPGPIFSARREFAHFLRLNAGHPWSPTLERAVARVGALLRAYGS
jgi:DNA-binding transcriptional MocR family regulator